jgi:glycosyltransferase involved in cell wall biosynthesis
MREKGILELRDATKQIEHLGIQVDLYGPMLPNVSAKDLSGVRALRYRGPLPAETVPETLSKYDVLVLPSHREGCPGAILEAYSAGLPVVATKVGGIPEIVDDGNSGILVPLKDVDALAEAMARLASSGEEMKRLREGAARTVNFYSSERWADDFVRKCRSLAGRNLARTRAKEGKR